MGQFWLEDRGEGRGERVKKRRRPQLCPFSESHNWVLLLLKFLLSERLTAQVIATEVERENRGREERNAQEQVFIAFVAQNFVARERKEKYSLRSEEESPLEMGVRTQRIL